MERQYLPVQDRQAEGKEPELPKVVAGNLQSGYSDLVPMNCLQPGYSDPEQVSCLQPEYFDPGLVYRIQQGCFVQEQVDKSDNSDMMNHC